MILEIRTLSCNLIRAVCFFVSWMCAQMWPITAEEVRSRYILYLPTGNCISAHGMSILLLIDVRAISSSAVLVLFMSILIQRDSSAMSSYMLGCIGGYKRV